MTDRIDESTGERRPAVRAVAELEPAKRPNWLARGRIPRGSVTVLVGDEGIGKSLFWVWIAAAVTKGSPLPEFGIPRRDPADVLLVVTEDDWSTEVLPRLEVAGADLARVKVLSENRDGTGAPSFPRDLDLVAAVEPAPAIVVVDAWLDTVPPHLNVRNPQHARQALHPWKDLAGQKGTAVALLTHTNRVAGATTPRERYANTLELRKAARMTLYAQQNDDGELVVGPEKANSTDATSTRPTRFVIEGIQHFELNEDYDGMIPLLRYAGESAASVNRLVENHADTDGKKAARISDAAKWLDTFMPPAGKMPSDEIKAAARAAGHAERTIGRAREELNLVVAREGRRSFWERPTRANDVRNQESCQPAALYLADGTDRSNQSISAGRESTDSCQKVGTNQTDPCHMPRASNREAAGTNAAALPDHPEENTTESDMAPESGSARPEGKELTEEEPPGDDGESFAAARLKARQGTQPADEDEEPTCTPVPSDPGNEAATGTAPLRSTNPDARELALPDTGADARAWNLVHVAGWPADDAARAFHVDAPELDAMLTRAEEARTA